MILTDTISNYILGRRVTKANIPPTPSVPEPLTFEEAQKMVQFEVNGVACRWNITEPLDIMAKEEFSDEEPVEIKTEIPPPPGNSNTIGINFYCEIFNLSIAEPQFNLPEASYKELEDYNICDAPARPNAYIRFIEKSTEELDGEVSIAIKFYPYLTCFLFQLRNITS